MLKSKVIEKTDKEKIMEEINSIQSGAGDSLVFLVAIIFFGIIFVSKAIKIIPQADIYVIQRLGKYRTSLSAGFHMIVPFIDSVANKLSIKEQIINIPKQNVITKDNVNIQIDGIVYIKVQNAEKATYNVENFYEAIGSLAMTTLRSEVGQLDLDETLSNRDKLNQELLIVLDSASENWGIKVMRVEISEISVPIEIEESMNLQMKAEREKRAIELEAIANKEALIRDAEGIKQKTVLEAEAIERMADAKKYEQEKIAEAQKNAIVMINEALGANSLAGEFILSEKRIKAFDNLAKSESKDKIVVPYETTELIGSLSILKDFISKKGN